VLFVVGFIFALEMYRWNHSRKPHYLRDRKVLETRGRVSVKEQGKNLRVETRTGRVLISLGEAVFLVREKSRAEFSREGGHLIRGSMEFFGQGNFKNRGFPCAFQGEGVLLETRSVVTKGKACGVEEGREYDGKRSKKARIPVLKIKEIPSGVSVGGSFPFVLEVSTDPFFVKDLVKFSVSSYRTLRPGNGVYHLRACVGGVCSRPQSMAVKDLRPQLRVIDKTPPTLEVSITPKGRVVIIRGVTETGVKVFVNGIKVPVEASGKFFHTLEFETPGTKRVVVEAVDSAGNINRKSKEVVIYGD